MRTTKPTVTIALMILLAGLVSGPAFGEPKGDIETVNTLVINADQGKETINRNIYGHFSEHLGRCIYGGFWVGPDSPIPNTRGIRNDIVEALKKTKIPVLRWPGGCFADEYHWKDGIGPREKRPTMVNTHWGLITEDNHFGTHEFLDLCEQLECEPYIVGNLGSGTVQEMQQWVEYITAQDGPMADLRKKNGREKPWQVKYFGIGNENWGCGGHLSPGNYAELYRRYRTYVRNFKPNKIFAIACGANNRGYDWTEVMMQETLRRQGQGRPIRMDGLSLHYYCGSGKKTNSATQFEEVDWFEQLRKALIMDELVTNHKAVMDKHDPKKKIAMIVDEWGTWHKPQGPIRQFLYMQSSLRDAMVAGVTLNIFNNHSDRVKMANIAQTINVLQAMILTKDDKMILTPTYHVFEMYKVHHDATLLPIDLQCSDYQFGEEKFPALNVSASKDKSGKIHISICNLDPKNPARLDCKLPTADAKNITGRVLTADVITAHNTFDKPHTVKPAAFNDFKLADDILTVTLPSKSIVVIGIE